MLLKVEPFCNLYSRKTLLGDKDLASRLAYSERQASDTLAAQHSSFICMPWGHKLSQVNRCTKSAKQQANRWPLQQCLLHRLGNISLNFGQPPPVLHGKPLRIHLENLLRRACCMMLYSLGVGRFPQCYQQVLPIIYSSKQNNAGKNPSQAWRNHTWVIWVLNNARGCRSTKCLGSEVENEYNDVYIYWRIKFRMIYILNEV